MTLYCTHHPCDECSPHIVQRGIKTVVCFEDTADYSERWAAKVETAKNDFKIAGIEVRVIDRDVYDMLKSKGVNRER